MKNSSFENILSKIKQLTVVKLVKHHSWKIPSLKTTELLVFLFEFLKGLFVSGLAL